MTSMTPYFISNNRRRRFLFNPLENMKSPDIWQVHKREKTGICCLYIGTLRMMMLMMQRRCNYKRDSCGQRGCVRQELMTNSILQKPVPVLRYYEKQFVSSSIEDWFKFQRALFVIADRGLYNCAHHGLFRN